ncbi:MAG: isochorismate synthase [Myxococcota bacterium]
MTALGVAERASLRGFLADVRDDASRAGRPLIAVWRARGTSPAAGEPLDHFPLDLDEPHFALELASRGISICAAGEVAAVETRGPDRFSAAERAAHALFADVRVGGDAALDPPRVAGPILVGGFAFDDEPRATGAWRDFPALRFWLPQSLLARVGAQTWRTLALRVEPESDPEQALLALDARLEARERESVGASCSAAPSFRVAADRTPEAYAATVTRALDSIHEGEFEKVVVARSCTLHGEDGFDRTKLLRGLRAQHPACCVFAVGQKGATFVGASPERLVRRMDTHVRTSVIAGSAPRGRTPEEDERLGRSLCESKKEQTEHAIVRRAVRESLAPLCASLAVPESPALLRLDGIQHLHTPVDAELRDARTGLLALAASLHPTPAVGGAPRDVSLAWLGANESLERGWYAGGIGWLAPDGDGELTVALRSALLRGGEATLFAGAGVVEGSTPAGELAETRLKLRTLLTGLLEI